VAVSGIEQLDLLDWKRRVFDLYREIRLSSDPAAAWRRWRRERDALFAGHPQSPLPEAARAAFRGLPFFDYDPASRTLARVERAAPAASEIETSGNGTYRFTRFGVAAFELYGRPLTLELYWLDGYADAGRHRQQSLASQRDVLAGELVGLTYLFALIKAYEEIGVIYE